MKKFIVKYLDDVVQCSNAPASDYFYFGLYFADVSQDILLLEKNWFLHMRTEPEVVKKLL